MPDLLIELFSEEIPARMQKKAAADLKKMVTDRLVDAGLTYEAAREYYTPRRLALDLRGLTAKSRDIAEERKGPSVKAPEAAIAGFLRSSGLDDISQAEIVNDPKKGDFYVAKINKPGRKAEDIIAEIMPDIIRNFPWPKSMRWGNGNLRWVRPLYSIICLFGPEIGETEIVDFEVDGIKSSNFTYGHRFLSDGEPITVRRFEDYVTKLENAKVILDAERRREIVLADAHNLCFAKGLELVEDEQLADEVAGLVEWPVVLMSEFEPEFLAIPPEIVRLTIRTNQKCFVTRPRGETEALSNHFILVSNIEASDNGQEIVKGNARVVRARLSDALYFWHTDQADLPDLNKLSLSANRLGLDLQKPLDQRMARLDHLHVTFHAKLGTQGNRVTRIAALAQEIAPLLSADPQTARRAALLAKADLQTEAVGEFPELQGVMGRKYATLQGESEEVARAIEEHYKPIGPTDSVPHSLISIAVALADKIDTLCGFWFIDEKPTGSKDPYSLRRAAIGVIRLVLAKEKQINMLPLLRFAFNLHMRSHIENALFAYEANLRSEKSGEVDGNQDFDNALRMEEDRITQDLNAKIEPIIVDLLSFMHERFKVHIKDEGARYDAIDAVLTPLADDLLQVARRIESLIVFINTDDGGNLLAGTKRAVNILEAEKKKNTQIADHVDPSLLIESQEKALYQAVQKCEQEVARFMSENNYAMSLASLAQLRAPVDKFFDDVLVNDENTAIRANRLALLECIQKLTAQLADFSKLVVA